MLSFIRKHWRKVLLVFAPILIAWFIFGSEEFQNCVCYEKYDQTYSPPEEHHSLIRTGANCAWGVVDSNHDAIIAFFTIIIGIFTGLLFIDAREKGRKELRAYLGVPGPIVERLGTRDHFQVQVVITNTGCTPANNVRKWMKCELAEKGVAIDFCELAFDEPVGYIAPDSKWQLREDFDWDDGIVESVSKNKKVLHVWGKISYEDIFGESHITEFRLKSYATRYIEVEITDNATKAIIRKTIANGWTLEAHPTGNRLT